MQMIIFGAGMAGLIAGCMIRDEPVTVYESALSLPNNHSAVLRFRSRIVADTLDIQFKRVEMMKCAEPWQNSVADILSYSRKTNGTYQFRSSANADGMMAYRYIAPPDFIEQMASRLAEPIQFNYTVTKSLLSSYDKGTKIISTIPMPSMMKLLDWPDVPKFRSVIGFNVNFTVPNMDAYATVYIPDPNLSYNRVSVTGNRVTLEFAYPDHKEEQIKLEVEYLAQTYGALEQLAKRSIKHLGVGEDEVHDVSIKLQRYAKILPIDENIRKRFIMWASENHGIYSLGRFATWRPNLLLDDVINDVRVIRSIIQNGNYEHRIK